MTADICSPGGATTSVSDVLSGYRGHKVVGRIDRTGAQWYRRDRLAARAATSAPSTGGTRTGTGCLTGYLSAGLTAGDKCVCVVDSRGTAKRLEALPGASGEPGHFNGQLDIHLPESTYLADGEFTTSDMLTFWTENMIKAEIEGYSFCRLVGEMTWALRMCPGWSTWSAMSPS